MSKYSEIVENFFSTDEAVMRELAERIYSTLPGDDDVSTEVIKDEQENYVRFFWENGAGDEANLIFLKNGGYLFFGYDHESNHNTYGSDVADPTHQKAFDNLPDKYKFLLKDPNLFWSWDDTETVYATCAVWLNEDATLGYNDFYDEEDLGGIDYFTGHSFLGY